MADHVFRKGQGLAWQRLKDEVVLIDRMSNRILGLNAVGARTWELLDGRPVSAVVDTIAAEFEVAPARAAVDVAAFLDQMFGEGLVELAMEEQAYGAAVGVRGGDVGLPVAVEVGGGHTARPGAGAEREPGAEGAVAASRKYGDAAVGRHAGSDKV